MAVKKDDVVKHISGGKDYALTASRLGYANVHMVYNWPSKIGTSLLKAIMLRMRAEGIEIPDAWKRGQKNVKS